MSKRQHNRKKSTPSDIKQTTATQPRASTALLPLGAMLLAGSMSAG